MLLPNRLLAFGLLTPLALGVTGCAGDDPDTGETEEDIIGGFPATDTTYDAVGALGFAIAMPTELANQPDAAFRSRAYITDKSRQVAEGETHFPFCSGTLIAKDAVLTAEHCVDGLVGDEEFLIGFDGTKPARTVRIIGAVSEQEVVGGIVGYGSDVAIAFLAEPITDIRPLPYGTLTEDNVGQKFVAIGYGMRDNNGTAGQRYLGEVKLRGIGGNHALNVWGSFEKYAKHVGELGDLGGMTAEELLPFFELLPEYEASFGNAKGNAQICFGDSGGPVTRGKNKKVYGVASAVVQTTEMICDWGDIHAVFGPTTKEFIDRQLECKLVTEQASCDGNVVQRCAPPEEGGWNVVETDCTVLGLICGQDELGTTTCIPDPCEGIPAEGFCDGDVATRCSFPEEGQRRVITTDCAALGGTCGFDDGGQLTCLGVPEPVGSCEGNCGGAAVDENGVPICWCDDLCTGYGDCCADLLDFCPGDNLGVSDLR